MAGAGGQPDEGGLRELCVVDVAPVGAGVETQRAAPGTGCRVPTLMLALTVLARTGRTRDAGMRRRALLLLIIATADIAVAGIAAAVADVGDGIQIAVAAEALREVERALQQAVAGRSE